MRLPDSLMYENLLFNINKSKVKINDIQKEIASGQKLLTPDSDPTAYTRLASAKATRSKLIGYQDNIQLAHGKLSQYDDTLGSVYDLMLQLKTTTIAAGNATSGENGADVYKAKVENILKGLISLGNTNVDGTYSFSGSLTHTSPFETTDDGQYITEVSYKGDNQSKIYNLDASERMEVNLSGREVFLGTAGNNESLFQIAMDIRDSISENGVANIDDHLTKLQSSMDRLLMKRGEVGNNIQHLEDMKNFMDTLGLNLDTRISKLQDTDLAEAAVKLVSMQTIYQASLAMASKMGQMSILDYLR